MKTNFENAVKILIEGRCDCIRPEGFGGKYGIVNGYLSVLGFDNKISQGVNVRPEMYLEEWECLGYKPKMETVEVKRWACLCCGRCSNEKYVSGCCSSSLIVELSGTYQRPVKEKVKRRVKMFGHGLVDAWGIEAPETAEFYAEWKE